MKKNYFFALFASLMLFVAMPAGAQVSSITDLYGKYQFTATITATEAGAAYTDVWSDNCEVEITKSSSEHFIADISNFAGADYVMQVGTIDVANKTFNITGPNAGNYGLYEGFIAVANINGDWPWDIWNVEGDEQFGMTFEFDADTKEIKVDDFTIVSQDWGTNTTTILAKVENVKMVLLEDGSGNVVIPDIAGHWEFDVTGNYALRQDTLSPRSFTMDLIAKDADMKAWGATFTFEGFEDNAFTLDATFDGTLLTVPFDSVYLDGKKIRLGNKTAPSTGKKGNLYFSYASKTAMTLHENIYIRKDTVNAEGVAGGTIVQVFSGYVLRENPNAIDWSGVYEVTIPEDGYIEYDYASENAISFPKTFKMTLEKTPVGYSIKELLGYQYGASNYNVNYSVVVNEDEVTADVAFKSSYDGSMLALSLVKSEDVNEDDFGDVYHYYAIADGFGDPGNVTMTLNDDGSITFGDFMLIYWIYDYPNSKNEYYPLVKMSGAVAAKKVFDWDGTYILKANVDTEDYPTEFEVVVSKNDAGTYFIQEFMDVDMYAKNQSCCAIEVADDKNSATISLSQYYGALMLGGSYPDYLAMGDKDGNATSLNVTLNADETLSMDDFTVCTFNFNTNERNKLVTYSNVVLTKKGADTAIENVVVENTVEGIFDMQGRQIDAVTAPGLYIVNGKKVLVK